VILTVTDDSNKVDEAGEKTETSHSDTSLINDAVTCECECTFAIITPLLDVYSAFLLLNLTRIAPTLSNEVPGVTNNSA
jgi:hypothetical protein